MKIHRDRPWEDVGHGKMKKLHVAHGIIFQNKFKVSSITSYMTLFFE